MVRDLDSYKTKRQELAEKKAAKVARKEKRAIISTTMPPDPSAIETIHGVWWDSESQAWIADTSALCAAESSDAHSQRLNRMRMIGCYTQFTADYPAQHRYYAKTYGFSVAHGLALQMHFNATYCSQYSYGYSTWDNSNYCGVPIVNCKSGLHEKYVRAPSKYVTIKLGNPSWDLSEEPEILIHVVFLKHDRFRLIKQFPYPFSRTDPGSAIVAYKEAVHSLQSEWGLMLP